MGVPLPAYLIRPTRMLLRKCESETVLAYFRNGSCDFCSGACANGVAILGG
jgi:hypothetical protein